MVRRVQQWNQKAEMTVLCILTFIAPNQTLFCLNMMSSSLIALIYAFLPPSLHSQWAEAQYKFLNTNILFTMRQQSEDEEGFIPGGYETQNKDKSSTNTRIASSNGVHYRYPGYSIISEHPLSLATPLKLTHESSIRPPTPTNPLNSSKLKQQLQHPYKYYCCSNEFTLSYSKRPQQPLSHESEFLKNEVPLFNLEEAHYAGLREVKPFQDQERKHQNRAGQSQRAADCGQLVFDSKFENGNLQCVFRRKCSSEYHLFMENDTNTVGYSQWFYFSVRNTRRNTRYTFHIVNYRKRLRFFQEGQRIVLFSLADAEAHKSGWRRAGYNYAVHSTPFPFLHKQFYTLSFSLEFPHDQDYVALASSLPYSYTKLLQELKSIQNEALVHPNVKLSIENVAQTICSNQVLQVTITSKHSQRPEGEKKMIVVMARQHPGQAWSSYLAQGFMRALLKDTPEVKYILEHFIVKVIPMVNVDGVVYGNFRCDVTGVDLNRRWSTPSPVFHPHIVSLKRRLTQHSRRYKVELCLDLHGHSKKYNLFCYSCKFNSYTCRILPYLIESHSPLFYLPSCTFGLSPDKRTTARAVISRIIRSENVLTLQTSSFGWGSSDKPQQFHPIDLHKFAQTFTNALRCFLDKQSPSYAEAEKGVHRNYGDYQQYDKLNEQESGSESEPEEDEIEFKSKLGIIFDKKYQEQYTDCQQPEAQEQHFQSSELQIDQKLEASSRSIKADLVKTREDKQNGPPRTQDQSQQRKKLVKISQYISLNDQKRPRKNSTNLTKTAFFNRSLRVKSNKGAMVSKHSLSRDKPALTLNQKSFVQSLVLKPRTSSQCQRKDIIRSNTIEQSQRRKNFNGFTETKNLKANKSAIAKNSSHQTVGQLKKEQKYEVGQPKTEQKRGHNVLSAFKQHQHSEPKKAKEGFFSRFQSSMVQVHKNSLRLSLLQQSLQKDDSSFQLGLMFENKRKLDLQRFRKYVQEQRQPGQPRNETSRPFADFKRWIHRNN